MPRSAVPIACLIVLAALLPAPARAWTDGDTLTTIMRPLPNLPSLVRPGDVLQVWADAPPGAAGFGAALTFGDLVVPLLPAGGGYVASRARWELGFSVPAWAPEEIYDLTLTSNATPSDLSRHAVKVLPAFKASYYFAQISDTHLPEHALSSGGVIDAADSSGMVDFDAIIDDLNLIHPEFILHTGDLVNEGELEEYLGMYEMGRAQLMLSRLRDPIFVVSGNHDQGGWGATAPPDGTARKNWWRHFGWSYLGSPPAGDPNHSQNFSFDYGLLHVIGMEAYINSGSYDHYQQNIWGAQSFTAEQMSWLASDVASVPGGHTKLLFYHYDFGGTLPNGSPGANFSQINPSTLGLDGAIWGHNHGVAEGNRAARPFNLGLQAVIDGRRTFRIFRVVNGAMSPGPMHHTGGSSGTPVDSLTSAWSGPNDGTRARLTATVTNRFGEAWDHAQLLFKLADHDSSVIATGGTVAQTVRADGLLLAYVDCVLPAGGTAIVSVAPNAPLVGVEHEGPSALRLEPPVPNPFRAGKATLQVRWAMPVGGAVRIGVYDLAGRRLAMLLDETRGPGASTASWNGRGDDGRRLADGTYVIRLETPAGVRTRKVALVR